jgi:Protein of unknown function (DUF4031)
MAVYVDDMRTRYRGMVMCHMLADTSTELHDMAERLGLKRRWFQSQASTPHYDISLSKRALAVAAGAQEVCGRDVFVTLLRQIRENWPTNGKGSWL